MIAFSVIKLRAPVKPAPHGIRHNRRFSRRLELPHKGLLPARVSKRTASYCTHIICPAARRRQPLFQSEPSFADNSAGSSSLRSTLEGKALCGAPPPAEPAVSLPDKIIEPVPMKERARFSVLTQKRLIWPAFIRSRMAAASRAAFSTSLWAAMP